MPSSNTPGVGSSFGAAEGDLALVERQVIVHELLMTATRCLSFPTGFFAGLTLLPASSFGVIDRSVDGEHSDYAAMTQTLNRFLLEEFATEGNASPNNPLLTARAIPTTPSITQLLGIDAKTVATCASCGFSRTKDSLSHVVDIIYPRRVSILSSLLLL